MDPTTAHALLLFGGLAVWLLLTATSALIAVVHWSYQLARWWSERWDARHERPRDVRVVAPTSVRGDGAIFEPVRGDGPGQLVFVRLEADDD